MHLVEELPGAGTVLALDGFGHEGGRGGGDGAAAAFETDVLDALAVQAHGERQPVAAQGVVPFRVVIRSLERAEIARAAVVIEDHVAVELLQVHQANTSRARRSALTSAFTSSSVL
jgi:hypothetical protein